MTDKVQISIIIPTHNRTTGALRAVCSVLKQSLAKHLYEIIVVANPHSAELESTLIELSESGEPILYFVSGLGVNCAKNLGVRQSKGEIIFFLDDDCELMQSNHLEQLLKKFNKGAEVAWGGGYLTPHQLRGTVAESYNLQSNLWLRQFLYSDFKFSRQLFGGNAAYREEIFSNIQFDEKIKYGSDEVALNSHLISQGYKLGFCHEFSVLHHAECTYSQFLFRAIAHGKNKFAYNKPLGGTRLERTKLLIEVLKSVRLQQARLYFDILLFQFVLRITFLLRKLFSKPSEMSVT